MSLYLPEVVDVAVRSVYTSGLATLMASCWSMPASYLLARKRRAGILEATVESLVGMPTVLLGLLLYMLFSTSGPLGFLRLLYTPQAIIVGQAILITPLMVSTSYRTLRLVVNVYAELALSLGANRFQSMLLIMKESMPSVLASIVIGFSRAVGELGVAMMLGGSIKGYTRVMTTEIALGVTRGEFESAILLGTILSILMVCTAIAVKTLSGVGRLGESYTAR